MLHGYLSFLRTHGSNRPKSFRVRKVVNTTFLYNHPSKNISCFVSDAICVKSVIETLLYSSAHPYYQYI